MLKVLVKDANENIMSQGDEAIDETITTPGKAKAESLIQERPEADPRSVEKGGGSSTAHTVFALRLDAGDL